MSYAKKSRTGPRMRVLGLILLFCCLGALIPIAAFGQAPAAPPAATPPAAAPAAAAPATPPYQPDATGSNTGDHTTLIPSGSGIAQSAIDGYTKTPTTPATYKDIITVLDQIGQGAVSMNIVWTLITGYLVMWMQAGFAMVETGFCRSKSAGHIMMTNMMIYGVGMLGFWIAGFAIMFGSVGALGTLGNGNILNGTEIKLGDFGIAGTKGFFLGKDVYDVGVFTMFLFQMVFMDTTATIPTGAMAERWRFGAFICYGFFVSIIIYPVYGHMIWGMGGLAMLGANHGLGHGTVDFAGSSVVHAVGGFAALAGAIVVGPRDGKFNKDGTPNVIPAHSIPMATVGCFILAFGWFGFNPGSTLAAYGGNMRIGIVATNTMLASASGSLFNCLFTKVKGGKYDAGQMINGLLAGLVAITAPCAFVTSLGAVLIGIIAGAIQMLAGWWVEFKLKVDDPVGAFGVHGAAGIWGLISVGIFADGSFGQGWQTVTKGYDSTVGVCGVLAPWFNSLPKTVSDTGQLTAQCIGAVTCMVWSFGSAFLFFKIQDAILKAFGSGVRSKDEDVVSGLDMPELGMLGYGESGHVF
jgi:Amt family ammonium transporter